MTYGDRLRELGPAFAHEERERARRERVRCGSCATLGRCCGLCACCPRPSQPEPLTRQQRNDVEGVVYDRAAKACRHETYAPCDDCLRKAVADTQSDPEQEATERLREAVDTLVLAHEQGLLTDADRARIARLVRSPEEQARYDRGSNA